MTRLSYTNRVPVPQATPEENTVIAESRIASGMNSYFDPADLANGVLSLALNAEVIGDRTSRTHGSIPITPVAPDTAPVLLYVGWKRFSGTTEYLRFTSSTVRLNAGVSWSTLTGTLTGTNTDRFKWMTIADATTDHFFFTNGVDEIQTVDLTALTYDPLGNAPKARYICGFFNRVVAAYYTDASPHPVMVGWSGDLNFEEWNPAIDLSAGSLPLVEAQSDFSDGITGLFGFAAVMLILRERSLWIATKRPVASNPFAFTAAFPSVGCDTPNSATQMRNGICWYDFRSNQVYIYEVGSKPVPVGDAVRNLIKNSISDPDLISATYNTRDNVYILTIPTENSLTTRNFKFHLDTGAWTYDEKDNVYGCSFIDGGIRKLKIDELSGSIDSLVGAIDDLGETSTVEPSLFYCMNNGDIEETDRGVYGEPLTLRSKIFRNPGSDLYINRLMLLLEPLAAGNVSVYFKKNNGAWTLYKTVALGEVGSRQRVYCVKTLRCNDYQWGVTISSGNASILEYKIEAVPALEDK